MRLAIVVCVVIGIASGYTCPALATEQRVALVIGNSAYSGAPQLRNPVNDAKAMADKLRSLGFDVDLKTNASQREMTRAFSQFGQKLVPGGVGLFYYAGHGVQVQGKNFLIPVDAEIANEASVRTEGVDVDQLLYQLGGARLSMVILDACRNNPFERRFRSTGSGGLAQIDAPTGSLLAYATAPGKVAADGVGANGLYTSELLKAIDVPGLRIEDVFKQVRINVLKASDNLQIPWESSSLTGEFYFKPGTKAEIENAQLKQSEQERADLLKELAKLRAELAQLSGNAATKQPDTSRPSGTAVAASSASQPSSSQVALAAPSASPAPRPSTQGSWKERRELLEQSRDQLTLSKALAILLDIKSNEDLELLLTHDREITRKPWHNAYAMGIGSAGNLIWGGSYQLRTSDDATQTALEQCAASTRDFCKVILVDGDLRVNEIMEVAKQMDVLDLAVIRQSLLQSIAKPANEVRVGNAAGRTGVVGAWSIGYSSVRQ